MTQPGNINYPMAILIIVILVNYVGMTYGPIGAFLAEFFPCASATPRCRCRTISATAGAAVWCRSSPRRLSQATGSIGYALLYPSWCRRCAS